MADTDNLVAAAADLGRRDAERQPEAYDLDEATALVVARIQRDEHIAVTDLEKHLGAPLAPRGSVTLHDWTHFADYTVRLSDAHRTTVWAQPEQGTVTAVFDDHADHECAGWRRHTATLSLRRDPDWQAWLAGNKSLGGQAAFAELIEDLAHTVVEPDAATMLEIARTFDAKRNVNFRSGVRTDSGDVQLTYEEVTKAKAGHGGQIDIPHAFTVSVAPYIGMEPVTLSARLRWRVADGELAIGYALLRPDRAQREAMDKLVAHLTERIHPLPVYVGVPPSSVAPR